MRFLLAINLEKTGFSPQKNDFNASDFGGYVQTPDVIKNDGMLIISSAPASKHDGHLFLWDGAPIDRDIAFSPLMPVSDAPTRFHGYLSALEKGEMPDQLTGVFCCASVSPDGAMIISPDTLSQYALFYIVRGQKHYFSNSLHLLEKTCQLEGSALSRDFVSSAFEMALGVGGWTHTGLAGVHKIPPHHYVRYKNNRVKFIPFSLEPLRNVVQEDYQQNLERAVEQQILSASAMRRALPDGGLVLDLSGGKDTRLVLGAQLAAGSKNIEVFLGGASDGEDQKAARRLVRHFGLHSVQYLNNIGEESLSAIEAARRAAYRFQGTSNLYQADLGRCRLSGVAQVRGGASGGRTRSFFPYLPVGFHDFLPKALKIAAQSFRYHNPWSLVGLYRNEMGKFLKPSRLLPKMIMKRGGRIHYLYQQDFLHQAFHSIQTQFEWLLALGVPENDLGDLYYIMDRGWRHCGFPVQVMNHNKTTFEPLNDWRLLQAELALSSRDRQKAVLARDMFHQYGNDDLLLLPFEGGDWPGKDLSKNQQYRREKLRNISSQKLQVHSGDQRHVAHSGKVDSFHNLGTRAYMKAVQPYMLELAGGVPLHHDCWSYMKRDIVLQAISSGLFREQKYAQTGLRLLHSLIWLSGDEDRS